MFVKNKINVLYTEKRIQKKKKKKKRVKSIMNIMKYYIIEIEIVEIFLRHIL